LSSAKTPEQERDEESARMTRTVRESVLWYLRRGLEAAAEAQRGMVEKRIERVREREKSVLYKAATATAAAGTSPTMAVPFVSFEGKGTAGVVDPGEWTTGPVHDTASTMTEGEVADIESQLSPEQLQLFAEENDTMLRHYEDTLGKVQYVFT
jgi:hypothetical protein